MSVEDWEELFDLIENEAFFSQEAEEISILSDSERIEQIKLVLIRIYYQYCQDLGLKFNSEFAQKLAQNRAELIFKEDLGQLQQLSSQSPLILNQTTNEDQEIKSLLLALSKLRKLSRSK